MSTKEKIREKVSQKEAPTLNNEIIVYNDDVNTFDHVIDTLMRVCEHTPEQAEQCSLIVHYNGKCTVKTGPIDNHRPADRWAQQYRAGWQRQSGTGGNRCASGLCCVPGLAPACLGDRHRKPASSQPARPRQSSGCALSTLAARRFAAAFCGAERRSGGLRCHR